MYVHTYIFGCTPGHFHSVSCVSINIFQQRILFYLWINYLCLASIRSHTANRKTYILLSHNHTRTLTHCGPGLAHYTRQNWLTLICYTHSHNLNMPSICSNSVTRRVRPNGNRVGATSPAQWQQQAGTTGYDYVYACERVCVNVCFCYLLHILLPLFLSFTRIFIYCCLLECRYHLSVYFRHMCRRTLCTQTRTLRRAHQHSQIHSHGVLLLVMHRRRRFMRSAPLSALMPWYPLHTMLEKVLN